jgi:hypothetical protein
VGTLEAVAVSLDGLSKTVDFRAVDEVLLFSGELMDPALSFFTVESRRLL